MNPRRRSTVHDLAALRLHRDNSRVLNSDTNLSSRRAKYALRDARGNWIAQDAGGLGKVKKRRSASQPDGSEDATEPEVDEEGTEDVRSSPSPSKDKGKGRAQEDGRDEDDVLLNPRAQKRRRFDEDLSYLESRSQSLSVLTPNDEPVPSQVGEDLPEALPTPSSDLLKCLHHFASSYYTAMGQLYDATREARQERKIRRLAKRQEAGTASSSRAASSEATKVDVDEEDSGEESSESSEGDEDVDEAESPTKDGKTSRKKRRRRVERHPMDKDMYKIFDGSALVALGMLLQEHVVHSLDSHVPPGWEKEMALIERNRRREERRTRQAQRMRDMRHPVKAERKEADEPESEDESEDEDVKQEAEGTGEETDEEEY
ncbi:hypothetical protein L226DRAFT_477930 [Lentinus tigrinus ALCF2SS1-7]|uniref:Uncharacterized protein n=1 Tax=Lentinus tigrinus ALCF2SS1-6 TaxID=1328759 RepID=A0A5C2SXF4_9APHY|nr:hypothetical protein L227DRAFT_605839 [Lentinus tigrinus ALCF2SS1-6]RPD81386.1 hypothetical protein L226DRAFT_477930 [Lentinus tigrinus ALCF2SS1-7]